MSDDDKIYENAGDISEVQSLLSRGRADELSFTEIDRDTRETEVSSRNIHDSLEEATFREIKKKPRETEKQRDLDFILDIPLEVSVEIGRARILIGELLSLGQGSVIELEKLTGEPVDIYANSRLIARGEVVTAGDKYGVRIIDILSPSERVKRLA